MEKFNGRSPWWKTYRKSKNHPKQRLSMEMVIRKSFVQVKYTEVLRDYVQHCSLVGFKQVCERDIPIRHRIFWIILTALTFGAVIYMLLNIWTATLSNPLLVTMESSTIFWIILTALTFGAVIYMLLNIWTATLSNPLLVTMESSTYPIAEIDFPAVAVCNINRISLKAVKGFAKEIYQSLNGKFRNITLDDIEWYLVQAGRLLDFSYNETLRLRLLRFADVVDNPEDIINGMKRLAPSCDEMLRRCSWNGQLVNCMDIFQTRRTVFGHCCAFNYALDYNQLGRPKSTNMIIKVLRQKQAGSHHGLMVVLDPLLEDYAYPLRSGRGFDIYLFDPTHYVDPSGGRVLQRVSEPNEVMVLELRSARQIATNEVRKYPLSIRKCLFHDEVPELYGDLYSYSACIARCRIKTIRSLCKCTPYYLPTGRDGESVCSLTDLSCLNKYREKLLYFYPFHSTAPGLEMERLDSLYCPECFPDCEFTKHSTKASVTPFRDTSKKGLNVTESSNTATVYIYQPTNDGVLDRLDVVSYWYEILSNVGGFAGVLVGFSIVIIFEIIYFFILRFIQVLYTNWKLYY
ncbi:sodium channel protein Nach-like [Leguminivora glycinivorella]|uniref:sodium channel protein Nach-like n=1 Tax=Leguminivora glycinivorella TaxID=1035111 RepID=UPI00200D51D4|nr:sodium channel protein Nach-like [Leguminivora glycinivorella]